MADDVENVEIGTTRCEPPEHLWHNDGWHWVARGAGGEHLLTRWRFNSNNGEWEWYDAFAPRFISAGSQTARAWRYLAPVTPPATVAALVAALEPFARAADTVETHGHMPITAGDLRRAREVVQRFSPAQPTPPPE